MREKREKALQELQQLNSKGIVFKPFSYYSDIIKNLEEYSNSYIAVYYRTTVFKRIRKMCTDKEVSIEKMKTGIKYNLDNTCMNYKLYICGSSGKLTWLYRDIAYIRNTTYMKTPYYAPDDFFLIRIKR